MCNDAEKPPSLPFVLHISGEGLELWDKLSMEEQQECLDQMAAILQEALRRVDLREVGESLRYLLGYRPGER